MTPSGGQAKYVRPPSGVLEIIIKIEKEKELYSIFNDKIEIALQKYSLPKTVWRPVNSIQIRKQIFLLPPCPGKISHQNPWSNINLQSLVTHLSRCLAAHRSATLLPIAPTYIALRAPPILQESSCCSMLPVTPHQVPYPLPRETLVIKKRISVVPAQCYGGLLLRAPSLLPNGP